MSKNLPQEADASSLNADAKDSRRGSSSPGKADAKGMRRTNSTQSGPPPTISRAYEFVVNEGSDMDESRRKRLRQHVMQDYMHRRRTLAAMGPSSETGRITGWRSVDPSNKGGVITRPQVDPHDASDKSSPRMTDFGAKTPSVASSASSDEAQSRRPSHPLSLSSLSIPDDEDEPQTIVKESSSGAPKPSSTLTSLPSRLHPKSQGVSQSQTFLGEENPGPQSLLGPGLDDPFDSLPIKITPSDQVLIHQYLNTLPYMRYQTISDFGPNPHKLLFNQVLMHDVVGFQALLALASKYMVTCLSGQEDNVHSLTHKAKAIELVNQRLQDPVAAVQDSTLYAVGALSVIEKWEDNYEGERAHFRGLSLLIKQRGGMKEIRRSNRFLESAMYWVEFSRAPGSYTIGSLPFSDKKSDHVPSSFNFLTAHIQFPLAYNPPLSSPMSETHDEICDLLLACEQFLSLFQHQLSLHRQRMPSKVCTDPQRLHDIRTRFFRPGSILSGVLAENPWQYRHTESGIRYEEDFCWMGSLFVLNFTLWNLSSMLDCLESYLSWLEDEVKQESLETSYGAEALFYTFWRDDYWTRERKTDPENGSSMETKRDMIQKGEEIRERGVFTVSKSIEERNWFVIRMLRVAKRLDRGSWERVRETLLGFIMFPRIGESTVPVPSAETSVVMTPPMDIGEQLPWNDDDLRREILASLYLRPPVFKQAHPTR